MKKVKAGDQASVKHLAAVESDLFREHMAVVEHCAMLQYDNGEPRCPGWFIVRTLGAAWQVQVKDPDSACSFAVVAKTLDEALATVNLYLGCEEAPWEPDTFLAAARTRNRKK